jgi:hypothetical protein
MGVNPFVRKIRIDAGVERRAAAAFEALTAGNLFV